MEKFECIIDTGLEGIGNVTTEVTAETSEEAQEKALEIVVDKYKDKYVAANKQVAHYRGVYQYLQRKKGMSYA